ncbi:hypothetical protein [Methanococcoides sp. FTZ1]|uniref:hypothetical protein n=1 Tax=Methanococcoides sp. FTZ1 TaxID=3439061 RepID=UPI003F843D35
MLIDSYQKLHGYSEECVETAMTLIDKLDDTVNVLDQLKEIVWLVQVGEIPEGDLEEDLWTELDLALADIYGILTRYKDEKSSRKVEQKEIDFLVSVRLKNLNKLSKQINLEDYPQMHLNYLLASYSIALLDSYYEMKCE